MQQPIVIQGRTLTQSNPTPSTVSFTVTPTDAPALRASGRSGASLLVDRIALSVIASGDYAAGSTFAGTGTGQITASTPRVECEGKQLLTENDMTTITCNGTITNTQSGATTPGTASVTVTITNGVQKNVDSNKA